MRLNITKEFISRTVLVLSCAAITGAWISEYVFGFHACNLCLFQRYFYMAAIFVLSINMFLLSGKFKGFFLLITSVILLLCAATAGYQVAIENKWVELPKICAAPEAPDSFEEFKEMITLTPHVPCDKVEWSMFGVSMAGYNFIFALVLGLFSFAGVFVNDKKKKKFTRR